MKPYQQTVSEVLNQVGSDPVHGLTSSEVAKRFKRDGPNALPRGKSAHWIEIFLEQFKNPLIYILFVAACLIFLFGSDPLDPFIISGVIIFNAIIGTIQEGKAASIVDSLQRLEKSDTVVVRDGVKKVVDQSELVVGDIIAVQQGQRVPADARIVDIRNIEVNEALLTGESAAQYKMTEPLLKEGLLLGDQRNMLFKGTYVLSGSAHAVVVATGLSTEFGKLHTQVENIATDIPLKKQVDRLSYIILIFILVACSCLLVIGVAQGMPFSELFVMLTALFICVVPEGLPVVLMLVLISGAYRMVHQGILVRHLQSVEGLGRTQVLIIDKTGTVTRNEMVVTDIWSDGELFTCSGQGYYPRGSLYKHGKQVPMHQVPSHVVHIGIASGLLNSTEINFVQQLSIFDVIGDPTEAALYVFAQKLGLSQVRLLTQYERLYEIMFSSTLQYHAGFFTETGTNKVVAYLIGAPEEIIKRAGFKDAVGFAELNHFLEKGLRVVAFGMKEYTIDQIPDALVTDDQKYAAYTSLISDSIQLLGFCGIQDSIRPDVLPLIRQVRKSGMHVIMATGDHLKTAVHVAEQVGIYKEGDQVLEGGDFSELTPAQLNDRVQKVTVCARLSPAQKVMLVQQFQQIGQIVAMTGDGINDVPAILAADIGIAMGQIGTELAKQSADLILLDDSFYTVVSAIEEGKHIFLALKRVILYFFATNMSELLIVLFAFVAHLPLPITAAQILWLNLVTDAFLDVSLSMEPRSSLLTERSTIAREHLVDWGVILKMFYLALPMATISLLVFMHYAHTDLLYARTMTLLTMVMFQWFNAWNCRSTSKSLFTIGLFSNRWFLLAAVTVLGLQFLLLYTPWMNHIFKTMPLAAGDWGVVIGITIGIIVWDEMRKVVVRWWEHDTVMSS